MRKGIGTTGELTGWQKFVLSFPVMPGTLSSVLIHNAFIKYYTDIIGLDPKFVGILYAVFGIWNAINDPAIGVWLDRRRYDEKRGKYVYIMRVTAPVMVLASLAMVFAQPAWNEWVIFAFMLALLFVYDTAMTAFNIAHANYKLIAAKTNKERVDVSVYVTYIANIGGFFGTLIPTLLLVGENDKSLTTLLFCAVLALNAILYFVSLKPLRDTKEMYLKENLQIDERKGIFGDAFDSSRSAFKSKAFVTFMLSQFIGGGPRGFYFTPFLYMSDYVLKLAGYQATIMDVGMGLALFAAAPFLGMLIKRQGMKNAMILSSFLSAAGFLMLTFVSGFVTAFAAYIVMYIFSQAISIAGGPMFGAIIDEDERRTGVRKAGMFNGLNALLTIPVSGIQASLFMAVISWFGFEAGTKVQTAQALFGIQLGAGLLPCVFTLLGIIPLFFLPIDRKLEQELSEFSKNRQIELASQEGETGDAAPSQG